LFLCLALVVFQHAQCSKRSWLGPTHFFDGVVPSARNSQGLASIGNKIYIFGGINGSGEFGLPEFQKKWLCSNDSDEIRVIE
jgi:hypothetical protein